MTQNKLKIAGEILAEYDLLDIVDDPEDIEHIIEQLEYYIDEYGDETCSYDVEHLNLIADVITVLKGV
jgi:hypothetical protein